ncbi:MAG: hypothetical protein ACRDIB_19395, partial [Ardenticatenaceae bacterium]
TLVTLDATGLARRGEPDDAAVQQVTVPAGGRRVVAFPVTAEQGEMAEVTIRAEGGAYSDGIRRTIPLYHLSAPEVVGTSGLIRPGEGAAVEAIAVPPKTDPIDGELTVELASSLAGATQSALKWVADFPYESVEAVVSTLLPNAATARALVELELSQPALQERLDEALTSDVERLAEWQNDDGGWGWWQGDASHIWLTAYATFGLHQAQAAGYAVPQETLRAAASFLQGWANETEEIQDDVTLDTRAFVLYVLSEMGQPDVARTVNLFDHHSFLGIDGRAFLLVALDDAGEAHRDRVQTLASELTANAILHATGAHWEENEQESHTLGTSTRSTAIALRALVRVEPEHMLLPQSVRWLMHAREGVHWETTQESAWSILALTDYMMASGERAGDPATTSFEYEVALNDRVILNEQATSENLAEPVTLEVAIEELLLDEANRLIVTRTPEGGEGRLYYSAWLRYFLPADTLAARNEGIAVERHYEAVLPETLESTGATVASAGVGDIVQVHLRVEAPNDLYFFTLEDPIPAGFEVIDPSLLTSASGVDAPQQTRLEEERGPFPPGRGPWWYDAWSQHVIRDEKVALFADRLPRGTYEYTYYLRATVPGEFNVLPAVGYEQYHPEVFGRSEGGRFSVMSDE